MDSLPQKIEFSCLLCGNGAEKPMKFTANHLGVMKCHSKWSQTGTRGDHHKTKCFVCTTSARRNLSVLELDASHTNIVLCFQRKVLSIEDRGPGPNSRRQVRRNFSFTCPKCFEDFKDFKLFRGHLRSRHQTWRSANIHRQKREPANKKSSSRSDSSDQTIGQFSGNNTGKSDVRQEASADDQEPAVKKVRLSFAEVHEPEDAGLEPRPMRKSILDLPKYFRVSNSKKVSFSAAGTGILQDTDNPQEQDIECTLCSFGTNDPRLALQHGQLFHSTYRVLIKDEVGKIATSTSGRRSLTGGLQDQQSFPNCGDCRRLGKSAKDMAVHLKAAHGVTDADLNRCGECRKSFKSRSGLKIHVTSVHSQLAAEKRNSLRKSRVCETSGRRFSSRSRTHSSRRDAGEVDSGIKPEDLSNDDIQSQDVDSNVQNDSKESSGPDPTAEDIIFGNLDDLEIYDDDISFEHLEEFVMDEIATDKRDIFTSFYEPGDAEVNHSTSTTPGPTNQSSDNPEQVKSEPENPTADVSVTSSNVSVIDDKSLENSEEHKDSKCLSPLVSDQIEEPRLAKLDEQAVSWCEEINESFVSQASFDHLNSSHLQDWSFPGSDSELNVSEELVKEVSSFLQANGHFIDILNLLPPEAIGVTV